MIITSALLGIEKDEFTKLYEVSIQLGAILAVVVLYWKKFMDFTKWKFYLKLIIAVIPAIILGLLFSDQIDAMLESPLTVAITLLLGGIYFFLSTRSFSAMISIRKRISPIKKHYHRLYGNVSP
jgi:undecaprenyl-diphosphatase